MKDPSIPSEGTPSPTSKSPSTPDTFVVTALNSSRKGCKRLAIERSPIDTAQPVGRKPRVPVYRKKEKILPAKLKPLFLVDKLLNSGEAKIEVKGVSAADKLKGIKKVSNKPAVGKENGQLARTNSMKPKALKSVITMPTKPTARLARARVAPRAPVAAPKPTRPSPPLRPLAPKIQFLTPPSAQPIRSTKKASRANQPPPKPQSKSQHFFTPPTIHVKAVRMRAPPSNVREPSFKCSFEKGGGTFGGSIRHLEVEATPSPAERLKGVGDVVPSLGGMSVLEGEKSSSPMPPHVGDVTAKLGEDRDFHENVQMHPAEPLVVKLDMGMPEGPSASLNTANEEKKEEPRQLNGLESILDNLKRRATLERAEVNAFKCKVGLPPLLASSDDEGGRNDDNGKSGDSMVDELKMVLAKRVLNSGFGRRVGGFPMPLTYGSSLLRPVSIVATQSLAPLPTTTTRAHAETIIPAKENVSPNPTSSDLPKSITELVSTAFGPRRVRKLFIPPLSEDTPMPSRDARIQLELKRLRAQKKVGGLGGEINGSREDGMRKIL